jgi:hypothetical protein
MEGFFPVFVNVVVPVLAGVIFFALARYVRHIAPLRTLVTGQLTYSGAYWSFLFLGFYLATRPLQILLGPYPSPLIVNNIREFFMIGLFGPAVMVAILSLVFGSERLPRALVVAIVSLGLALAMAFVVINIFAIGGSEEIFRIGRWVAYDGVWFKNSDAVHEKLMNILFMIRFIDPVLMVSCAGFLALWHARHYPVEKKMLYDNMPRKLYILGAACFAFSLSMLFVGLIYIFAHIANQWWIYYLGALASGFLETFSLAMPLKKSVIISEHARTLS